MHSLELDIGRALKALAFTLACALLILVPYPLRAQEATPTPNASLVQDLSSAANTLGATTVINTGIVVLLVIVAWRGLAPLISTITRLLDTVRDTQKALEDERQERQMVTQKLSTALTNQSQAQSVAADQRAQTADSLERTANILSDLETKGQAAQGRKDTVETINTHTEDTVKQAVLPIGEGIGDIKTGLNEIIKKLDVVATRDQLEGIITPISTGLKSVVERVGDLEETIQAMIDSKRDLPILRHEPTPPDQVGNGALAEDESSSKLPGVPTS